MASKGFKSESEFSTTREFLANSNFVYHRISVYDESSKLVGNTGLKRKELDEKAVIYQSAFFRIHHNPILYSSSFCQ